MGNGLLGIYSLCGDSGKLAGNYYKWGYIGIIGYILGCRPSISAFHLCLLDLGWLDMQQRATEILRDFNVSIVLEEEQTLAWVVDLHVLPR